LALGDLLMGQNQSSPRHGEALALCALCMRSRRPTTPQGRHLRQMSGRPHSRGPEQKSDRGIDATHLRRRVSMSCRRLLRRKRLRLASSGFRSWSRALEALPTAPRQLVPETRNPNPSTCTGHASGIFTTLNTGSRTGRRRAKNGRAGKGKEVHGDSAVGPPKPLAAEAASAVTDGGAHRQRQAHQTETGCPGLGGLAGYGGLCLCCSRPTRARAMRLVRLRQGNLRTG
jgi:hypothetical protein